MAGDDGADRTEKATPRRRREARNQGQVARSAEINSVVVLLCGVALVFGGMGWMGHQLLGAGRFFLSEAAFVQVGMPAEALRMILLLLSKTAIAVAPVLLGTMVMGTAAAFGQVGWNFSTEALQFKFEKLNPIEGLKQRFFSKQAFFELAKNLLKVVLLGAVAGLAIRDFLPQLVGLSTLDLMRGWDEGAAFIVLLVLRMIGVMAVLAVADFLWQRYRTDEQMKMTKEEIKREAKDSDGDPQIKSRIRSLMYEQARRRMMDDVKTADVVLANPTHYSVAIRYRSEHPAPQVVAKGQGILALRIREVARQNRVPVVEDPPLARALYRAVKVGGFVPVDLFESVARVLATVYRAARKRGAAMGGR